MVNQDNLKESGWLKVACYVGLTNKDKQRRLGPGGPSLKNLRDPHSDSEHRGTEAPSHAKWYNIHYVHIIKSVRSVLKGLTSA